MHLCAEFARDGLRCDFEAATVDHGLRPGSREEAERVAGWARACGFGHRILQWDGRKPATRIQETARAARYALLCARAREIGAQLLVTAHTLDDQAETVLMRMAHGSGLAGLAGMSPALQRDGVHHVRPLLGIAKARLVATCQARGWPYIDDPSNADPRFARTRWRRLAALLATEGLTAGRLAKLAERLRSAENALEANTAAAFRQASIGSGQDASVLDMTRIVRGEPREIGLRLLRRALPERSEGEPRAPIRLERLEAAFDALSEAFAAGVKLRRTLGGAVLTYDGKGRLTVVRENLRQRGSDARRAAHRPGRQVKKGNSNAPLALV
jgi:tRNA(Ile)-lysidine synthase